jgi:ubiquitin carboxyl-terminal hydrolase 34
MPTSIGIAKCLSIVFGSEYDADVVRKDAPRLLHLYVNLVSRIIHVDCDNMASTPLNQAPKAPVAYRHLEAFKLLLYNENNFIRRCLGDGFGLDTDKLRHTLAARFLHQNICGLPKLCQFISLALARASLAPVFADMVGSALQIASIILNAAYVEHVPSSDLAVQGVSNAKALAQLFHDLDQRLRQAVKEQNDALHFDIRRMIVPILGNIIIVVPKLDEESAKQLFLDIVGEPYDHLSPFYGSIANVVWKIKLMKEYICNGRMELRVLGVETMQNDLVGFFNENRSNHQPIRTRDIPPAFQCVADVLKTEKIVDFLVGISSHPQIISRCANIIGFLVVSNNFTKDKIDLIWNTLVTSQDPRVATALFTTLSSVTKALTIPSEDLYLCQKMLEAPLPTFGLDCVQFLQPFIYKIRDSIGTFLQEDSAASVLMRLCTHFITRTTLAKPSTATCNTIRSDACKLLNSLASSVSDDDRRAFYSACVDGIKKGGPEVAPLLQSLLQVASLSTADIVYLATEGLTSLIMQNTCDYVETVKASSDTLELGSHDEQLFSRLNAVLHLLGCAPDSPSEDLPLSFWNHMLGADSLEIYRDIAWKRMASACNTALCIKYFLRFFDTYLPTFPPACYTPHFFVFVQNMVAFKVNNFDVTTAGPESLHTAGVDLLWGIILTALERTGEQAVMEFFVKLYLSEDGIVKLTNRSLEENQLALVQRCISRMEEAHKYLRSSKPQSNDERDSMDILEADRTEDEERAFQRMVWLISTLLNSVRSRSFAAQTSPVMSSRSSNTDREEDASVHGEAVTISYQAFRLSPTTSPIRKLTIGDLETRKDLHELISRVSVFTKFKTIWSGSYVHLTERPMETLRDFGAATKGLMMVREEVPDPLTSYQRYTKALTRVEQEVLGHFDSLYKFADADDSVSLSSYELLRNFSPHETICALVMAESSDASEVFPPGQIYKVHYSLYCLDVLFDQQKKKKQLSSDFVLRSVRLLETLLFKQALPESAQERLKYLNLFPAALPVFSKLLKSVQEVTASPFAEPKALVEQLFEVLNLFVQSPSGESLTSECYDFLCIAVSKSPQAWAAFKTHPMLSGLHYDLLLAHRNSIVRRNMAITVKDLTKQSRVDSHLGKAEWVELYWPLIADLLPKTLETPPTARELMEVVVHVFREQFPVSNLEDVKLDLIESYQTLWPSSLLSYFPDPVVGQDEQDFIVIGFCNLLVECFSRVEPTGRTGPDLAVQLWKRYLFPDYPDPMDDPSPGDYSIPILDEKTRSSVYSLIRLLTVDSGEQGLRRALTWTAELVPLDEDARYGWSVDPTQLLRAESGYLGLRNLGNTCYMNSLLTQLYMNPEFRQFLFNQPIHDSKGQALLNETQALFGHMQSSYLKSADPYRFTRHIHTYTDESINISEQMDVEEFFNLLFDQWEGQMPSAAEKQAFRSFYGGKLVYQIKSKECSHVSEREEPYLNIQCDVQGKANLHESLQSFVEGDVMQGGKLNLYPSSIGRS